MDTNISTLDSKLTEPSELAVMARQWVKAELNYAGAAAVAAVARKTADNIEERFMAFRSQRNPA